MADVREIFLAGGCFWCVEDYYLSVWGVIGTECGYANGHAPNPTYEAVSTDSTGCAETVRIVYDNEVVKLSEILGGFYKMIDPTALNSQRGDNGTRYRTGIYYTDERDEEELKASLLKLQKDYGAPVLIELERLTTFHRAEEYHQRYYEKERAKGNGND